MPGNDVVLSRSAAIDRIKWSVSRKGHPRLYMLLATSAAGLVGFALSAVLLRLGIMSMPERYGIAALGGYGAFLLSMRLWLESQRQSRERWKELEEISVELPDERPAAPARGEGSHDESPAKAMAGGLVELAGEAEVFAIVGLALAAGAAVVGTLIWLGAGIVDAPALMGEMLLDGVITGAAYRRLRQLPPQHWVQGIIRRTWKRMALLTTLLVAGGAAIQSCLPAVHSIADLFR